MPSSGAPHFRDPRPLVVFLCSPAAELNNRPLVQYSQRGFIQISGLEGDEPDHPISPRCTICTSIPGQPGGCRSQRVTVELVEEIKVQIHYGAQSDWIPSQHASQDQFGALVQRPSVSGI